jgi:Phosducin
MSSGGLNLVTEQPVREADDDDVRGEDDENLRERSAPDEEEGFVDPAAVEALGRIPGALAEAGAPRQRQAGNTGPKGVIADFRQAEAAARVSEARKQALVLRRLKQMCITVADQGPASAEGAAAEEESEDSDDLDALERELLGEVEESAVADDDFLKQYRKKRMQELQAASVSTFGWLHTVTAEQFVPSLDCEPPSVTVIVHLFEDHLRPCKELNRCLRAIARRVPEVKFIALRASSTRDAGEAGWDDATLPIVMVYRGGELVESFVKMTLPELLGPNFDEDSVEAFLRKHELL